MKITTYAKLSPSAVFTPLKPERIHSWFERREKVVKEGGTFVKLGDSHSMNMVTHKDAIFLGTMLVQILRDKIDCSHLADFKLLNQGKHAHA